jgi:hypothetical protein
MKSNVVITEFSNTEEKDYGHYKIYVYKSYAQQGYCQKRGVIKGHQQQIAVQQ